MKVNFETFAVAAATIAEISQIRHLGAGSNLMNRDVYFQIVSRNYMSTL